MRSHQLLMIMLFTLSANATASEPKKISEIYLFCDLQGKNTHEFIELNGMSRIQEEKIARVVPIKITTYAISSGKFTYITSNSTDEFYFHVSVPPQKELIRVDFFNEKIQNKSDENKYDVSVTVADKTKLGRFDPDKTLSLQLDRTTGHLSIHETYVYSMRVAPFTRDVKFSGICKKAEIQKPQF